MNNPYTPPQPVVSMEKVVAIRTAIAHLFAVADTSLDEPHKGYMRYRGRFLQDPADCFDELSSYFEEHGFTPTIRREESGHTALVGLPHTFTPSASNWTINLALFIATILSTLFVGATGTVEEAGSIWRFLLSGWPFSLSIMLILGAHELGHYFAARYHKVPVTLPYFIPVPSRFSLIGTLGAFIRLKAPVKNRRALLDIGVAGPLAGLVFAIPILLYGLATSDVGPLPTGPYLLEGNSILYALAKIAVFGRLLPGDGMDVSLNGIAWAGWVGLLVTGLNLMPVGQLDGGHVAYVLWGKKAARLFEPVIVGLGMLTLISLLLGGSLTWGIWIILLFFFGRVHAEPLDDVTPLDARRRWIAILAIILFILVFVPVPLRFMGLEGLN